MNLTLRQLKAFVAVAQQGGFTAAADRLHLTQSALSVLIRTLEQEMGVRLLDRTTRMVRLTDAGREFYPIAERTLVDLQHAVDNSKDLAEKKRGRVTIAATPLVSASILPKAIASFCARYPGIGIKLLDDAATGRVQQLVRDGEADLGVAPANKAERDVQVIVILEDALIVAFPHGHPLGSKPQVTWRDLAGHPFIALARDNSVRQLIDSCLAAAEVRVEAKFEVAILSTAIGLVDAGLGISVLPSYARELSRPYHIQFRRLVSPTAKRELCLLSRGDRVLSPAAQSFRDFLIDYVKTLEQHEPAASA